MVGDSKILEISSATSHAGSEGTFTYNSDKDEIVISVQFGGTAKEPKVVYVPDFQVFAAGFEEAILEGNIYVHPAGILTIVAGKEPFFWVYVNEYIWGEVARRDMLDFVRVHACTRKVVTNVPPPPDPVLRTEDGSVIHLQDSELVFDAGGLGLPEDARRYPIDPQDFVRAYHQGDFPHNLGSALNLFRGQDAVAQVERFYFHLFGADSSITVSLESMADFVGQIDKLLVWEKLQKSI